jgi:hypothetical protein
MSTFLATRKTPMRVTHGYVWKTYHFGRPALELLTVHNLRRLAHPSCHLDPASPSQSQSTANQSRNIALDHAGYKAPKHTSSSGYIRNLAATATRVNDCGGFRNANVRPQWLPMVGTRPPAEPAHSYNFSTGKMRLPLTVSGKIFAARQSTLAGSKKAPPQSTFIFPGIDTGNATVRHSSSRAARGFAPGLFSPVRPQRLPCSRREQDKVLD